MLGLSIILVNNSFKLVGQKKSEKPIHISGQVGVGYEYGLLPFVSNAQPPQGNAFSNGVLGVCYKGVPLTFNYHYSSVGTISGLNNYARLRFDSQSYRKQLKEKLQNYKAEKIQQLTDLQGYRQKIQQQLLYLDMLEKGTVSNAQAKLPELPSLNKLPFSLSSIPGFELPSEELSLPEINTNDHLPLDSLKMPSIKDSLGFNEALGNRKTQLLNMLSLLQKAEGALEQLKGASLDSLYQSQEIQKDLPGQSKLKRILSYTDKLELGLCYPDNNVFTVARTPVRGVNFEYSKHNKFFAFTHGRTVNNLFIGNNVLQNNLNAARNLYNFFDFNNVESGRRITSIKYGWGAKSGTHLYLGVLHGYGKTSYLDSISTTKEHNLVGEVDAQWTINKTNHLAFSYGRSYIQADQINNTEQSAITASFFDFTHRSNAALLNYKLELPKTRTEVSVSGRLVDPFFKSLGLGFMRSDNLRYEGRLKQRIGKTFKLSGFYRRERDNLLAMYDFNNVLMSYGVGAELKIKRSGFAKVDLRPVVHSMDAEWIVWTFKTIT